MPACATRLAQLRLLQRVVELHQQLPGAHPLAIGERQPLDAAADLGAQHHALVSAQRAHRLRVVFQRDRFDLADFDRHGAATAGVARLARTRQGRRGRRRGRTGHTESDRPALPPPGRGRERSDADQGNPEMGLVQAHVVSRAEGTVSVMAL